MPSGYTAALYESEQDFKDFVLTAARAMGALIHMRDTSLDAEITLPEVSSYHKVALDRAQKELTLFTGIAEKEWERRRDEEHQTAMRKWFESQKTVLARRERYEDMLDKVWSWHPPSNDHVPFKQYMIDQLVESKKFDCSLWDKPKLPSVEEYKENKISKALRDITYHSEELRKETERVRERREWIKALLDSLPDE